MTFNGDTVIGKPTLALVEIFIAEKGLFCEAQECYDYWENKNWLTQKGKEVKTLESAICVYNGIAMSRAKKKIAMRSGGSKKSKKQQKREKKRLELKKAIEREYLPYDEQLKDKRWKAFRNFVFAVRGQVCEKCGSKENLQVHHPKYISGKLAWEYNCNEVMVLCSDCHCKEHNINK